jgi:hypothetical protein
LTDISGKTVAQKSLTKADEQVALPVLAAGTYIAEIKDNGGKAATKKIVIE